MLAVAPQIIWKRRLLFYLINPIVDSITNVLAAAPDDANLHGLSKQLVRETQKPPLPLNPKLIA